ncbi:MAG: Ig-like domain-containing protein [Pseudomonadota bacterium]
MAATVATQNVPFESQTPSMLRTVDADFRRNWFGYVRDHEPQLLQTNRVPNLAIWYSSASRDFQDYNVSGKFGIYSVTTPPTPDDTWWAKRPSDSVVTAPHLGGYRGMSAAMIRMNIPHTVVHGRDTGPAADATDLDMLLLPSVGAMSDADAQYIRNYVQNGGVLLATGDLPGTIDETGAGRAQSVIADLFDFPGAPAARVNQFGSGLAIYRPDIIGSQLFGAQLDSSVAADMLSEIEKLVRIHVDEPFSVEDGEHLYVDRAIIDADEHLLFVVNYSGLQLPLTQNIKQVAINYHAPAGKIVTGVVASTPDSAGLNGFATVTNQGHGVFKIQAPVDQFALLEIKLADAPATPAVNYEGPQFATAAHAEAAQSGLDFVLDSMRNSAAAIPNRYGVYTNLLDNENSTEIYTNGHHVTGEHMGLLLRTSACMGDESAFDEAYQYVSELMYSPLYHIPNWSIDKNAQRPFLFYDDFRANWFNANAPLDDLRMIHGLIDGYENFARQDASDLADAMFEGLYWTSVTDRSRNTAASLFPQYSGGLLGFAWDWSEVDDNTLTPPSSATGTGYLGTDLLPVDYQDLGAIAHAAERDQRWHSVLQSTTQLLLDSEITLSGLYYNGYRSDGAWTGDFEYQGDRRGEHLKVIQVLWTAIHLARVSKTSSDALSAAQKALAQASAARSLTFFKDFYLSNNRVPEYLTFAGNDVADCVNNQPADCLDRGSESLFNGEARIYAQIARLALLLGDRDFSNQIINEKIITDRITNTADPRYGMIGVSTAGTNDAEAWNVLESVFSMCLNALSDDEPQGPIDNNNAPIANNDTFSTNEETPLLLAVSQLLANDTDADNDTLAIAGLPSRSTNGGRVQLLDSGDWQYTPDIGFSGEDSVSYAISDGRGGTAIGQIEIDVRLVPKSTHLTESVSILTGTLNYGSVEFLTTNDADTYDVDAAQVDNRYVVDWSISGSIANRAEVTRLIMTYAGHYSVPNVSQETFLYNFNTSAWESFDTRIVGEQTDSVVRIDITVDAQNYIATNGETRVRIRGTQTVQPPTVWANSVSWLAYRGNQNTGNNAPVATGVSASTPFNTPVNLSLQGSDADGDAITYTLDTTGLNGSVSGTAPNLTFTPQTGFTGTDSFTYSVSDATDTSDPAVVTISVLQTGVISNLAAGITTDGDLGEWAGYLPFDADPDDVTGADNPLDWRQVWMAHDGSDFYIAYRNDGPVDVSWGQTIYLDIDDNPATGAQFGLPIGADRVLQGRFLYSYAGSGNDWNWNFITEVSGNSANGSFEYRIPRAALGNSELIKLALVGSNEPYGGSNEDLYPDGVYNRSAANRFFTYTAEPPANTPPTAQDFAVTTPQNTSVEINVTATDADNDPLTYSIVAPPANGILAGTGPSLTYTPTAQYTGLDSFQYRASDAVTSSRIATVAIEVQNQEQSQIPSNPVSPISVDGNLDEWQALQYFADDPVDVTGAENPVDYLRAAMAHDTQYFYLTFTNDGQNLSVLQHWLFTVYIDTDLNPATGYQSGLAIGADYMQQAGGVHSYTGTGSDWTWLPVSTIPRAASGSSVEVAIPRQMIGDPSELRLVLIGDNLSIGGLIEDVYPDGSYNSSAAIRYLSYRTGGGNSEPAFEPALNEIDDPVSGRDDLEQNAVRLKRESELEPAAVSIGSGAMGVLGLGVLLSVGYYRRRRVNNAMHG